MFKAYNFIKEDCEECDANTKLLHRVVGLEVEDIKPEDNIRLVDSFGVCMTPTVVFTKNNEVIEKICRRVTKADLDKIFS